MIDPGKEYKIMNKRSGQVIDRHTGEAPVGSTMCQYRYYAGNNQEWRFVPLNGPDNGYYEIKSSLNGNCIAINGDKEETPIVSSQWETAGKDSQKWKLTPNDDSTYKIFNKQYSGMLLAVLSGSLDSDKLIITCNDHDTENERWYINPVV